ncbi:MAG TPA: ATP-binding protein [Acidimicrobiales bacterium]|nr:ATP-binding protein [Acidimicrobiales bacterium]
MTGGTAAVASGFNVAPDVLDLAPELSSVRSARNWVADVLSGQPKERSDAAVLLTSELVTNAVLYAAGPIRISVLVTSRHIRIEVCDSSSVVPLPKAYDAEALTGRGLDLVGSLSDAWGVDRQDAGKAVWFEIGASPSGDQRPDPASVPDVQGDDSPDAGGLVEVRILGLPPQAYLDSEQHNDALMREFALISRDDRTSSLPRQLLELVAEIQLFFGAQVSASRAQIVAAVERGDQAVDLHIRMHPRNRSYVERSVALLTEADRYCREGDLLTLAASEEILRFRDWYLGQVLAQLDGAAPSPWPYG